MTEVIKTPRRRYSQRTDPTKNIRKHSVKYEDPQDNPREKIQKIKDQNTTTIHEYEPTFNYDEYVNMRSLKKMPVNNVWIDALAREMTKWIDEDVDAIRLDEFLQKKSMLESDFRRLAAKSPVLKSAWEYCLRGLGRNREVGAWKRGKNWQVASYNLPYYCPITKETQKQKAKLREEAAEGGTKIVIMPSVEEYEKELKGDNE